MRQGDPISPNLFLLVFRRYVLHFKENGNFKKKWQASKWRLLHPENHLLFADDNFLFFKAYIGAGVEVNNAFQA
jgi:hypothetical protein